MPEPRTTLVPIAGWIAAGLAVVVTVSVALWSASTPSVSPSPAASSASPSINPTPTRTPVGPLPTPSATPSRAKPKKDSALPVELTPVKPSEVVQGEDGMRVGLTSIESVAGQAAQPGEVAGPAIRVTVRITNETGKPFNTSSVAVNAYSGKDRKPAGTLVLPGGVPFYGRIAPGESAYGVYLFTIPESARDDVTITVDYAAGVPTVVFQGSVA